jgi:hypothetical protein
MKMKIFTKILLIILLIIVLITGLGSCLDSYDRFNEELYEKYVYIVSRGTENVFDIVCRLDTTSGVHNVSVSVSGTNEIDKDVTVTFERDTVLLSKYNYSRYEVDSTKYAVELSDRIFNFPSLSLTLKPGSRDVYGLLPFNIEPENLALLCPDSAYFIPLAIKSISEYEVNEDKRNALIRIYPQNRYAEMQTLTYYASKGFYGDGTDTVDISIIAPQIPVYPLKANSIRTFVATQNPATTTITVDIVNRYSIEVTVTEQDSLIITPYRPEAGLLEIEQLPIPSDAKAGFQYINHYVELPDPYVPGKIDQRFFMHYRWRSRELNTDPYSDDWRTVRVITSRLSML